LMAMDERRLAQIRFAQIGADGRLKGAEGR
jgi:hypothetical protein